MTHLLPSMVLLLIPVLGLSLVGCGASKEIPFERLTQGGIERPGVQVIGSREAWAGLWTSLRSVGQEPTVDWEEEVVLGVFLGQQPSGGYSITIQSVQLVASDRVEVRVVTRAPSPNDMVTMAITYPGDVVSIKRTLLPAVALWTVEVRNQSEQLLFQTTVEGV